MIQKILVLLFIVQTCSCERIKDKDTTIWVYKMKNDYSKNVPVELSSDKSKITSAPGNVNTRWPILLVNNYFLNGSMGPNTAYLSLTIEEYNAFYTNLGVDSLYKMIIDKEPFIAFYQRDDYNNTFRNENGAYGIDTILINELIRNNELEKYFTKLK